MSPPLLLGANQGWIPYKYARDLSSSFDPREWRRVMEEARYAGAEALRVWLFEGEKKEGIDWDGGRPVGLSGRFLDHLRALIELAEQADLSIYWTALSGNWPKRWGQGDIESYRHYNLLQNKFGAAEAFRQEVLGPTLEVIAERPAQIYALDLMNEVQGSVKSWRWSAGWEGARRWLREMAAFAHSTLPGLKVTGSCGHHTARQDILDGRLDGLGLDLYDIHIYTDEQRVPDGKELVAHARSQGLPIVIGELGQRSQEDDPALQARVAKDLIGDAMEQGFGAAFVWRVEEEGSGRFRLYDPGSLPRPVVEALRQLIRPPALIA